MKLTLKKNIFCIFFALGLCSCKKEPGTGMTSIKSGKYVLDHVKSDAPIDLNFDGVENTDLTREASALNNIALYIKVNTDDNSNHYINVLWIEPRFGEQPLYSPVPQAFDPNLKVEYFPVDNAYYFNYPTNKILLETRLVNDPGDHTFSAPAEITLGNDGNTLTFTTNQRFLTKSGIRTTGLTAKYNRVDDYIMD